MPRDTTLNTGAILRQFGIGGGEQLSRFSDGPTQPVVVVSDLSSTFTSERIEPRGIVSLTVTVATIGDVMGVVFDSLGPGGIVIEQLTLETLDVGFGIPFPQFPQGSWLPWKSVNAGTGGRFALDVSQAFASVMQVGGVAAQTAVRFGTRSTPTNQGIALPNLWQSPTRLYVPPGDSFAFQCNALSDGAGNDPVGTVLATWREVTGLSGVVEGPNPQGF